MTSSIGRAPCRSGWLTREELPSRRLRRRRVPADRHGDFPFADEVVPGRAALFRRDAPAVIDEPDGRRQVQAELARALMDGPGIVVFKGAFDGHRCRRPRDRRRSASSSTSSAGAGVVSGDHFAKPGANDRVWNALEKLALHDPRTFVDYYSNDILNLVSVAWLGPGYQVTSQVNVVNPGGTAQTAHRDYHLGFMSEGQAARYPSHVHRLTPGADPPGSGSALRHARGDRSDAVPPHSQKYEPGYLAFHLPDFSDYFDANYVQLPLVTGDAAFFNPALFHGAGSNRSADVRRMANLLQVSSAFGRAMESVDRAAMLGAVFPTLRELRRSGRGEAGLRSAIAATAEGYAFPTDLDKDPPVDGLAPETQAELAWRAVDQQWTDDRFLHELSGHSERRTTRS